MERVQYQNSSSSGGRSRGRTSAPTPTHVLPPHQTLSRNRRGVSDEEEVQEETFNILPLHDMLADHDALRFPEVRAAHAALQVVGELPRPEMPWRGGMDLLDWLGAFFGFQIGNVKNQREHLVLLLANDQMKLQPPPEPIDQMDQGVVRKLRKKVLKNYISWCSFLG